MSNFTFLTEDQCFGAEELDVFKKRGTKAAITDFSVLLGGFGSEDDYVDNDSSLEGRTGQYWTKTACRNNAASMVINDGSVGWESVDRRYGGARPALSFSSISSIPTNGESGKRARDGVLEVEYGYYPQKAVSRDMQERLERAYRSGSISRTKNSYTTDSRKYDSYEEKFLAKQHEEYEFERKKICKSRSKFRF